MQAVTALAWIILASSAVRYLPGVNVRKPGRETKLGDVAWATPWPYLVIAGSVAAEVWAVWWLVTR